MTPAAYYRAQGELHCDKCAAPLPVHHFPGAIPEAQAVFTWRDGKRLCAEPCAPEVARPINPPSGDEE